jgi:AcrR family transcriptional regulator
MTEVFEIDTKTRILDVAERLFADQGFESTSLRQITTAANVNLAAVNYHFRSKDELIRAVFMRRIGPVNRKRLEMLESVEAAAGEAPPPLEPIMEAFYGPVVELHRGSECRFQPLFGRIFVEPGPAREFFLEEMVPVAQRFGRALRRSLPDLPEVELMWRVYFSAGILAFTMAGTPVLNRVSGGACDPTDVEGTIRRMVAFACAGLRAPLKGDLCPATH